MTPEFAFPPPPPPPRRTGRPGPTQQAPRHTNEVDQSRGTSLQGRGGGPNGLWSTRHPIHLPAGAYVNPNFHRQGQSGVGQEQSPAATGSSQPDRTYAGQKRKLDVLRGSNPTHGSPASTPAIAPSVPSFNVLHATLNERSASTTPPSTQQASRRSLFGSGVDQHESSDSASEDGGDEDDADEEAMYAQLGTKLVFEYDGQVTTLNSEAELLQWQQERRNRFPTSSRVAQKEAQRRTVGEERKRLLAAAYALTRPAWSRQVRDMTQQGGQAKHPVDVPTSSSSGEASLDVTSAKKPLLGLGSYESEDEDEKAGGDADPVIPAVGDESDDDPPEVLSFKVGNSSARDQQRPACKYFFNTGRCKEGEACQFRHDIQEGRPLSTTSRAQKQKARSMAKIDKSRKKGIHQLLVDQEHAATDALALRVIKHLGSIGFFDQQTP